jgi:hypothetical protein
MNGIEVLVSDDTEDERRLLRTAVLRGLGLWLYEPIGAPVEPWLSALRKIHTPRTIPRTRDLRRLPEILIMDDYHQADGDPFHHSEALVFFSTLEKVEQFRGHFRQSLLVRKSQQPATERQLDLCREIGVVNAEGEVRFDVVSMHVRKWVTEGSWRRSRRARRADGNHMLSDVGGVPSLAHVRSALTAEDQANLPSLPQECSYVSCLQDTVGERCVELYSHGGGPAVVRVVPTLRPKSGAYSFGTVRATQPRNVLLIRGVDIPGSSIPEVVDEFSQSCGIPNLGTLVYGGEVSSADGVFDESAVERYGGDADVVHVVDHGEVSSAKHARLFNLLLELRPRVLVLSMCSAAKTLARATRPGLSLLERFFREGTDAIVAPWWEIDAREAGRFARRFYPWLWVTHDVGIAVNGARRSDVSDDLAYAVFVHGDSPLSLATCPDPRSVRVSNA